MLRSKQFLFLLALVSFTTISCKNNKQSAEQVPQIEQLPAYKNLNDSIHAYPSDVSLYKRRAIRLSQDNAHELAFADFQKLWSLQPNLENALLLAANLEIQGRNQEKLALMERLNKEFPENAQVERLLAEANAASGNPVQALKIYNYMITKDSLDPEIWYEKALILEQLNDTAQAINALQKAYTSQGVDTYGLELAHLYAEQKNPRALLICDYILRHDSAQVLIDPFFIKGIYFANIKQYQKAVSQFDSCIFRDWKTTDAYLEKGRAYFYMENFTAAIKTFNMAITVTNTDPDAYFWLGRCYEAQHRNMDAIINYRKAVALDKHFIEAQQRMNVIDSGFAHRSH